MKTLFGPVQRLRIVALVEGVSFLLLLFVSMPLKYYFDMPEINRYVGFTHGYLFILYLIVAIETCLHGGFTILNFLRIFVASLIPFGTFLNDPFPNRKQIMLAAQI